MLRWITALSLLTACAPPRPDPTSTPTDPQPPTPSATEEPPVQGERCGDAGVCAEDTTCVEFFGIAGASGPKFSSCEIPCPNPDSACPEGQQCITIADGPGRVCRPAQP
jgi:hypothetical protein